MLVPPELDLWTYLGERIQESEEWFFGIYCCSAQGRNVSHHLEVDSFPSNFILYSAPGPFLMADEELGWSKEIVDIKNIYIVEFTCVIFQVQDVGTYPLGIDDPLDSIDFCILPLL